ncbi:uncharacterized protein LOC141700301 [Apium graveolens]|uniref:uncharacterized protein LOC141700301 n=1 Tax=Apium graveolens TaxID=4045 RepID=UPI003D7B5D54
MAKAQTLKAEFESLNMKDSENLDNFCMKLNGMDANIRALGEIIGEEYVVKKLLKAVPTKFLQIASAIEQFGNLGMMSVEEVIGSLQAHKKQLSGQVNRKEEQQLLLTEEEWSKYENNSGKLFLTRDKWLNKSNRGGSQFGNDYHQGRDSQGGCDRVDRRKIKCFNRGAYGHFGAECRKPRRNSLQRGEANLTQINDDEPALLMVMNEICVDEVILLIEGVRSNTKEIEENTWYLHNGASNHMTGRHDKFEKLDKSVRGQHSFDRHLHSEISEIPKVVETFSFIDPGSTYQYALDFGRYLGRGNIYSESTTSPDKISRTRKGVVKGFEKLQL